MGYEWKEKCKLNGLWYQKSGIEVVGELGSDLHKGLAEQEAALRLEKNGPNELKGKPRPTLMERLLAQYAGGLTTR